MVGVLKFIDQDCLHVRDALWMSSQQIGASEKKVVIVEQIGRRQVALVLAVDLHKFVMLRRL
jgi:hypothetical protein